MLLVSATAFAAGEVTIKGKGVCAKCSLKEVDHCQNAIQVTKDGKTTTYYIVENDVSKAFHKTVCHGPVDKVTAVGKVKEVDGKLELTVTKLEAD